MARSFNTTRTAAFLFCLVGGFVPALGADLTVSANDKRAIEDLVQKFNQAVNSRNGPALQRLFSPQAKRRDFSGYDLDADRTALGMAPPLMSGETPSSAHITKISLVGANEVSVELKRQSFASGGGPVTRAYALVVSRKDGKWQIGKIRSVLIMRGMGKF